MAVLAFKLVSGQEIIAEATANTATLNSTGAHSYTLSKPHVLQLQQHMGNVGLVLIPWFLSAPDVRGVEVGIEHIVAVISPDSQVEKQYLSQTSGISLDTTV